MHGMHTTRKLEADEMWARIKKELGHEPLEPGNQYCKHCGCALFHKEYRIQCEDFKKGVRP